MEASHSATTTSWIDTGKRGGQVGKRDGGGIDWGHICFGCGTTFTTDAALIAHLLTVHGAA